MEQILFIMIQNRYAKGKDFFQVLNPNSILQRKLNNVMSCGGYYKDNTWYTNSRNFIGANNHHYTINWHQNQCVRQNLTGHKRLYLKCILLDFKTVSNKFHRKNIRLIKILLAIVLHIWSKMYLRVGFLNYT